MVWRWLRASLQRIGINLPFRGVICVEGTQTITIDQEWRASITTRRKLVFVESPSAGDLYDSYGLGLRQPIDAVAYSSPDAVELRRDRTVPGRLTLYWWPQEPVALYTLYEHEAGWKPTATFDASALCVEYACDMRTGVFSIECVAPARLEGAVLFERPRRPWRLTERAIVQRALKTLTSGEALPRISEDGKRVTCDVRGPKAGQRYIFVAFRMCGVADSERWLHETSMLGRAQRLIDHWAHAIRG